MHNDYDVVVIGGGLAGVTAALFAKTLENRVLLISKGYGSFYYGLGTVDLFGGDKGQKADKPWEKWGQLGEAHPYNVLGEKRVRRAVDEFVRLLKSYDYPLVGRDDEHNMLLTTALGSLRPSYFASPGLSNGDVLTGGSIKVFGIDDFSYLAPKLAATNLSRQLSKHGIGSRVSWGSVKLGFSRCRPVTSYDLGLWLDDNKNVQKLIELIMPQLGREDRLGFPGVLGLARHSEVMAKITQATGKTVFEIPTLPPCLSGIRLHRVLSMILKDRGIHCITGYPAVGGQIEGNLIKNIKVAVPGKTISYYGKKYILAAGGLGSEGLVAGPGWVKEPIFNLPVSYYENVEKWTRSCLWQAQPYTAFGLSVDDRMRPVDREDNPSFNNLYAAGNILANFDSVQEKSATGIDIASGFAAGQECGREAGNHE